MKQKLLTALRYSRLLGIAEWGYGQLVRFKSSGRNRQFRKDHPDVVFPPSFLMFDPYGAVDYSHYWRSGAKTTRRIEQHVNRVYPNNAGPFKILDWGCGPARVVRQLASRPTFITSSLFGCDYNSESISWASENIVGVEFELNKLLPPLPYAEASFDIIYGVSVFTHLSEGSHIPWVDELRRVLAPGGLLLLTFQGEHYRSKLLKDERLRFDAGLLVERGLIDEGKRLYCAFHPEEYVKKLFGSKFDEVTCFHADESIASPQYTMLARKPKQT